MTAKPKTPSDLGHAMRALLQAVANGTMSVEAAWISVMREIDPPPAVPRRLVREGRGHNG